MEIYRALSDFTQPNVEGSEGILEFCKGDRFEIFDCHKSSTEWWGARALRDNSVGYVPSKYMEFEERKIGRLLPDNYESQREESLRKFTNMQNTTNHRAPDELYPDIPEPEPDYNDDDDDTVDSSQPMVHNNEPRIIRERHPSMDKPPPDSEEVIIHPKKLHNPCLESKPRMDLHKELLHNYKMGINILEKPELNKVLEQRKKKQRDQEWEAQKKASSKRTSLELKLEERATKIKDEDTMHPIEENENDKDQSELSKVHAKIRQKTVKNGTAVK